MGRFGSVLAMCGASALALSSGEQVRPWYLWNASESVPIGLYRLRDVGELEITELVAVRPPEPLAKFLDLNGYLPSGLPMLKRVLALPGQTVCRIGFTILIDGVEMGAARARDGRARPLPVWQGCRIIADGDVFVMNWQSADSLDSRYFGAVPKSAIIGRALPVWTREE